MVAGFRPKHFSLIGAIVLGVLLLASCSQPKAAVIEDVGPEPSAECRKGVTGLLGVGAEVLKCGLLTGSSTLQAVGAMKISRFVASEAGWPVSHLIVAQSDGGRWHVVLSASKDWIKNEAGYVGIEFIDDSYRFPGYWAAVNKRDDGRPGILISLTYMRPNG